jgi:hypothetical protein
MPGWGEIENRRETPRHDLELIEQRLREAESIATSRADE